MKKAAAVITTANSTTVPLLGVSSMYPQLSDHPSLGFSSFCTTIALLQHCHRSGSVRLHLPHAPVLFFGFGVTGCSLCVKVCSSYVDRTIVTNLSMPYMS